MASIEDPSVLADEAPQGLAARLAGLLSGVRRRKLLSLGIALAIEALILLLLLTLGARIAGDPESKETVTEFAASDFSAPPEPEAEQPPQAQPEDTATPVDTPPVPDRPTPLDLPEPERPKPPIVSNPTPEPPPPPPAQPAPRASPSIAAKINPNRTYGPTDSGPPRTSMDSERVGTAPNGEPLYAARWYREPTQQELAGYLSTAKGPGVALIACKTVPDYYVEDCVLISESPAGSLMGRAALAAAWQFRVRPARVGGRELVGSWVRIRVSYTVSRGPN